MAEDDLGGNSGPGVNEAIAAGQLQEEDEDIRQDDEKRDGGKARGTPGRIAQGNQTSHSVFLHSIR